jgi:2'-5' RNA ligase
VRDPKLEQRGEQHVAFVVVNVMVALAAFEHRSACDAAHSRLGCKNPEPDFAGHGTLRRELSASATRAFQGPIGSAPWRGPI